EIEGESSGNTNRFYPALPGYNVDSALRSGASVTLAVGDPFDAPETRRRRYTMQFLRYSRGFRWLDFAVRHNLPSKLGPITLVDPLRGLNLEESVVISSEWLTD